MIKLKEILANESVTPLDIKTEADLQQVDDIIQLCREMGETSPVLWRGIRVKQNYPMYHFVQDRDSFRGGNLGAQTIMKELGIKNPAFAYLGNMQTVTKLFGRTFAIVLKKPYRLFQSPVVDDVMAWAQTTIYKDTSGKGYSSRHSIGTRTEKQQVKKALEGAKTFKQLSGLKALDDTHNEVILDTPEYWGIDVDTLYGHAGKFVRQIHKEKEPVAFGRIIHTSDYVENYGEILEILWAYRKYTAWKLKNPR